MEDRDECIIIGQIYGITGEKRDDRQAELCLSDVLWNMTDEQKKEYNALLDVNGSGIMGYLDIPKISVTLPIYHGTDEAVLQIAIGHLAGTSLPVGGAAVGNWCAGGFYCGKACAIIRGKRSTRTGGGKRG